MPIVRYVISVHVLCACLLLQRVDIKGCKTGSPTGTKIPNALCFTNSDESGVFLFTSVPVGSYLIVSGPCNSVSQIL